MADHARPFDHDAELRPHNEIFRAAARVGPRDRVLDIGPAPRPAARLVLLVWQGRDRNGWDSAISPPRDPGPDGAAAFDNVTRLWDEDRLAGLDAATVERARTRLRAALDAHSTGSGVYFDSCAWIVEARRHS
ncbi:hypothetical protein ACQEU6_38995 [Spirillospora sp. CA-108201]